MITDHISSLIWKSSIRYKITEITLFYALLQYFQKKKKVIKMC